MSPTTTTERMKTIAKSCKGFAYYVSLKGVTGAGHLDIQAVEAKVQQIRQHVNLPIGVGFGIHNAESAKSVGEVADAVIIGSAIIKNIEKNLDNPPVAHQNIVKLLEEIRQGLDS